MQNCFAVNCVRRETSRKVRIVGGPDRVRSHYFSHISLTFRSRSRLYYRHDINFRFRRTKRAATKAFPAQKVLKDQMPDSEIAQNLFVFRRDDTPGIETARPEARLVERVCNGEEQAFAEIYKMFAPIVPSHSFCRVCRMTTFRTSFRKFF